MTYKILTVDDDVTIIQFLRKLLTQEGYLVSTAPTEAQAGELIRGTAFDLYLLDLMLPDGDGFSLCRRIRTTSTSPVLILTVKDDPDLKVMAFDAGADDYLIKPCTPKELLARIRAHLRRSNVFRSATRSSPRLVAVGDIVVDRSVHDAVVRGKPAGLTHKEFELLELLSRQPGRAYSKDRIFEQLWGDDAELAGKTLVVHIRRLRQKIELNPTQPRHLLTVRGYGYKLSDGRTSELPR